MELPGVVTPYWTPGLSLNDIVLRTGIRSNSYDPRQVVSARARISGCINHNHFTEFHSPLVMCVNWYVNATFCLSLVFRHDRYQRLYIFNQLCFILFCFISFRFYFMRFICFLFREIWTRSAFEIGLPPVVHLISSVLRICGTSTQTKSNTVVPIVARGATPPRANASR